MFLRFLPGNIGKKMAKRGAFFISRAHINLMAVKRKPFLYAYLNQREIQLIIVRVPVNLNLALGCHH
jgi:hypothetical protein